MGFIDHSVAAIKVGRLSDARAILRREIERSPDNVDALNLMGVTFIQERNFSRAELFLKRAMKLNATCPEVYNNYGLVMRGLGNFDQELCCFKTALQIDESYGDARINLAACLERSGKSSEAIGLLERWPELYSSSVAVMNLGVAYLSEGLLEKAAHYLDRAILMAPSYAEAHWNRSLVHLAKHEFCEGWQSYEWRRDVSSFPKDKMPCKIRCWTDDDPGKGLLVFGEQGLGDEVFFSSALALVNRLNSNICVKVDRRLVNILSRSFPAYKVVAHDDEINEQLYDRHLLMGSVFYALRHRVSNPETGSRSPYLRVDQRRVKQLRSILAPDGSRLCGITWRSHRQDMSAQKSSSLDALTPLMMGRDVRFVSLQYGDVSAEIQRFRERTGIQILECDSVDNFSDIDGHAALIEACDFTVLVSNSTAHLAGALGKPTLMLAPKNRGKFFYWNALGPSGRSFWYPSVLIAASMTELESKFNDFSDMKVAISK